MTIKIFMHMHIQTKCLSLIYHLDSDLYCEKQKSLELSLKIDTNEL
jgi:hypothetical protein